MKKLFAILALVLGMVSCQTEPEGFDVVVGGEQDVMLSVSLPEGTRAASSTGFDFTNFEENEDYDLRFILEISYNGKVIRDVKTSNTTSTTFPVRLAPNREYTFTVWADLVEEGSDADLYYNTANGLANIELITKKWTPNVEARDAFTNSIKHEFKAPNKNFGITLYRPFAKVRVVATDIQEVLNFNIIPTSAEVVYTTDIYTGFDAVAGEVISEKKEERVSHSFAYTGNDAVDTYTDVEGERTLFTDYIFVPKAGSTVQFILDVKDASNTTIKQNNFNTTIPVAKNKVTTIKGNVLTEGGNVSITVDGVLGEGETINYVEVDNAEELVAAIENVENGMIKLGEDVNLDDLLNAGILVTRAEKQYGLQIPAGKTVILDLNGKRIYQAKECTDSYSMIRNNGELTITGNGIIEFTNTAEGGGDAWGTYTIENSGEGVLTIDNATIRHNGCVNGEVNRDTNIAIQNYQGKVVVNKGTIESTQFRSLRDFTAGGEIIINGGTFLGQVWMQGQGNGSSSLTINGGNFSPVAGYDGSSVYITNSGNIVNVAVNGGMFNTKIGCYDATKEGAKGCITGGAFTTTAMENTNIALLANGYVFAEIENGTYTVENVGHYTDEEGNHYITNAKGLAWVSENVNTMEFYVNQAANIFDGKTVYLANDIDLGGAEWRPIGDYAFSRTSFNGVFDGQGYTVSNFKITNPVQWDQKVTEASYGFFGNVKGTIKNLTIKNATVNPEGGRYSAALVGRLHNGGSIENCHVVNSSVTIQHWQVGGLVGQNNNGNISSCSVVGSTITGNAAVGVIVGMDMAAGEHTIKDCRIADTALVQNGSFGASYDASYGLAVGLVNASGIVLNVENVVAENNTIKGVATDTLVGDIETGATVTINGVSIATTADQLAAAIKAGGECVLGADIAMTASVAISNANFTLDGNGKTITMAEDATNTYALFDITGGKATFKNVTFDGIKSGAVVRTVGVEFNAENVTAKNGEHTQQQGLFRLMGKSTIKNSTFKNNSCSMVITLNYDGANNDPQVVENCVFEGNTCNGTAVLYYVKGEKATINGNKFIGNTVNCEGNGATIYMGFTENNVVTNNLFQNNTVNEAGESSRVAGGVFFGYETVFTGNAFISNKVTGKNAKGNDVCVSTYYTSIDLSGNYWGGNAPVEDTNYFVQHKSDERVVIINNYLTANPFN